MTRRGFTLIEVIIAMVIVSIIAMGLGRFVGSFAHAVATSNTRVTAASVAREQAQRIQSDPAYPLPAGYAGTVTGFPGFPAMVRITTTNRVTGTTPARDYTVVTIRVTERTMRRAGATRPDTVNLTIAVAKP